MKIIHCADLHLDSKMETHFSSEQARERRYEILETFENMVNFGCEQGVSVIIIAGDLFDTPQHQQKTIKNRVLEKIKNTQQIEFLYLQGNHDRDDYFKTLSDRPQNLKLFGRQWMSHRYEQVVITGMECLEQKEDYDKLLLRESDFNIVALHGQVEKYGNKAGEDTILLSQLQNKYIDYLALGHIHEYKGDKLDYRGIYQYSGCLEGRGFDETGEKGFVLLEVLKNHLSHQFVPFSKRKFHEITIELNQNHLSEDCLLEVENQVKLISKDDMVKIVLSGKISETMEIDLSYIEQKWKKAFYFMKVIDQTQLFVDYRKYENDISFKGEFIRTVNQLDLDEDEKSKVIMMGIHAIVDGGYLQ